jgi:U6 snRNA-associated Sm-like protein LSm7
LIVLIKFIIIMNEDPDDPFKLTEDTRALGLVVCRGTAVVVICPVDGMESIPNPFIQHE